MVSREELNELLSLYPRLDDYLQRLNGELSRTMRSKDEHKTYIKAYMPDISAIKCNNISDPTFITVKKLLEDYETHIAYLVEQIQICMERKQKLGRALMHLNAYEREIIELVYWDRFKWHTICKKLNIGKTTLNLYKNQILAKMCKIL